MSKEAITQRLIMQFHERGDQLSLDVLSFRLSGRVKDNIPTVDSPLLKYVKENKVVLYGAGQAGHVLGLALPQNGIEVLAYVDSYKKGQYLSLPIITLDDYIKEFSDVPIVISTARYSDEIEEQLKINSIKTIVKLPHEYLINPHSFSSLPDAKELMEASGTPQYLSLHELPKLENEVFVDCGAYDGATTLDFLRWCTNPQKAFVFIFEPDPRLFKVCKDNLVNYRNIKMYQLGVGECEESVRFKLGSIGDSVIDKDGEIDISVVPLDRILHGERVSFIKMDIEGAEIAALRGAAGIIRSQRPKLAICVYHKVDDIYMIPEYIWSLNSDYKFYLRHYTDTIFETVLYAI